MELHQKIINARKKRGLTQEQLADLTNVTVRTIQRIESGESMPRSFTLKTIATALEVGFEELTEITYEKNNRLNNSLKSQAGSDEDDRKHFLQMLCLSCFSYLVIPFIHFLIPRYILKKSNEKKPEIIAFARRVIIVQVYWQALLSVLLMLSLAYNLITAQYFQNSKLINYLWPFFMMNFVNILIIISDLLRINKTFPRLIQSQLAD